MRYELDNGKYTVLFEENSGHFRALRYGEEWRDLTGDGMVLAMLQELDTLRKQLEKANAEIERTKFVFEYLPTSIKKLMWKVKALEQQLSVAREALEDLAKLGNGDEYGNSIGNEIARKALEEL